MFRALRCCLLTLLFMVGVFVVSAVLVGGLLWMLFQVPDLPEGVERIAVSAEAADSFELKLKYSAEAWEQGIPTTVSFNEEELTSIADRFLKESSQSPELQGVRDPQIRIVDGELEVSAVIDNPLNVPAVGPETKIRAILVLEASGGVATWSVTHLDVGRVGLPGRVRDVGVDLIQLATGTKSLTLPEGIDSISIEGGQLVVETGGKQPG